jgi:hypothetical protein
METLANNDFGAIRDLLDLPEIYGSWNAFMPKFFFAVLFHKVQVLGNGVADDHRRQSASIFRCSIPPASLGSTFSSTINATGSRHGRSFS